MKQIFYDCSYLTLEQKKKLLEEAKALSFTWWVDFLDCSISPARQRIDMSWEDITQKLKFSDHFVSIQRVFPDLGSGNLYGEIGFCTSDNHFLFIYVELSLFSKLMNEKKLKPQVT